MESQNWIGLGSETYPFTGEFDGNGHIISNFNISKAETSKDIDGFFTVTDGAIIKNLGLKNVIIYRDYSNQYDEKKVGGLVGLAKNTSIYNCFVDGYLYIQTNANAFSSKIYLGGIVGDGTMTTYLYNCYTSGTIEIDNKSTHSQSVGYAAGLIAYCGYIYNSFSTADIECKALTSYAFGLGYYSHCENSFATGDVISNSTTGNAYVGNTNYSPMDSYNVNLFAAMSQKIEAQSSSGSKYTYNKGTEKVLVTFYDEEFILETIGFNKYISEKDLEENINNVWVFPENNYPKLYWES